MVPVQDLLNRIRWDREFGRGSFEIGYLDHVERRIVRVPFTKIHFSEGNRFTLQVEDEWGDMIAVPFHRIREVYKNGAVIWQRPDR